MAEPNEPALEPKENKPSPAPSEKDWEAESKHFQAIADQRDARLKDVEKELSDLKQAQEAAETEGLKEKEKFKELYEQTTAKLADAEKARQILDLSVKLQSFISEQHPEYAPDFKWIVPHVASEEEIASVVADYVKAHPKAPGIGTASPGNRGPQEGQVISQADLNDPVKLAALLKEDPDLPKKLNSGEIKIV